MREKTHPAPAGLGRSCWAYEEEAMEDFAMT
jgi:hypothetical protein